MINQEGKVLLSSEGYTEKENLLNGIESVKKNIPLPDKHEMKTAENGKHFFNLKSANGQVIKTSAKWESPNLGDTRMKKMKTEVPQVPVMGLAK